MKTGRIPFKRSTFALLILLLLIFSFRLGSYLLLPSEPVALLPGLRYSGGPIESVFRLGLPKKVDSHLSDWREVLYVFESELDGSPVEIKLCFTDSLWLTNMWVRAEAEDPGKAKLLFEAWCDRLEAAYRENEGYRNHGTIDTCNGKELRMEIDKGALGLICTITLEGSLVSFYGENIW